MKIPDSVKAKIKREVRERFLDDSNSAEQFVEEEGLAYKEIMDLDLGVLGTCKKIILKESYDAGFHSWELAKGIICKEIDAAIVIRNFTVPGIAAELIHKWKREVAKRNKCSFARQLSELNRMCKRYLRELEIDSIKPILLALEKVIGNACYNGNIQNYESWGEFESEGRWFRYPVRIPRNGHIHKYKYVPSDVPALEMIDGYYAFGANEMAIFSALDDVLKYLEKHHGLDIGRKQIT